MGKIRVLKKEPGKKARWVEIENELKPLQKAVGGYLETVTLCTDLVILCDEEGRLKGLPYNCEICGVTFVGPILICGAEGEEFADLRISPEAAMALMPHIQVEEGK